MLMVDGNTRVAFLKTITVRQLINAKTVATVLANIHRARSIITRINNNYTALMTNTTKQN